MKRLVLPSILFIFAALAALAAYVSFSQGDFAQHGKVSYAVTRVKAAFGNRGAQFDLGRKLAQGDGVAEDDDAALYWYGQSANGGDTRAELTMARLNFTGQGIPQDDTEAAKWMRRAAAGGSSYAQAMMGMLCLGGIGTPQDAEEALGWFKQSHEQEAYALAQGLQVNLDQISLLQGDDKKTHRDDFYKQSKTHIGDIFTKLVEQMKQQGNKGESDGN